MHRHGAYGGRSGVSRALVGLIARQSVQPHDFAKLVLAISGRVLYRAFDVMC